MTFMDSKIFLESESFAFSISPYTFQANEHIMAHAHNFFELVYVSSGQGKHYYKDQNFLISDGDVFMIEPGELHAYESSAASPLRVFNVLFQPELLQKELHSLAQFTSFVDFFYVEPFLRSKVHFAAHLRLQTAEQLEFELLLQRMVIDFNEKKLGYQLLTKTRLIELFVFLSRYYHYKQHSPLTLLSSDEKMMLYISEFIGKHYAQPLTLLQVSEICQMSTASFSTKFKQYIGKTFIEYRNDIRIKAARQLLEQTDHKITHIAAETGFEDLSFFNKQFKLALGQSPRDYRKSFQRKML